ncbi:unknown protein [Microcystis aeruginosa NIES-843]|uniref:Uncharacterized protein n=1 Tax=Microcystis aeruginosa (strain NIES-843 / IAM M-2473) TaxID=449447 RepID=B0JU17_MICAN|nr:unknown protein [Microcystis aeruginosa NIES-843]
MSLVFASKWKRATRAKLWQLTSKPGILRLMKPLWVQPSAYLSAGRMPSLGEFGLGIPPFIILVREA